MFDVLTDALYSVSNSGVKAQIPSHHIFSAHMCLIDTANEHWFGKLLTVRSLKVEMQRAATVSGKRTKNKPQLFVIVEGVVEYPYECDSFELQFFGVTLGGPSPLYVGAVE